MIRKNFNKLIVIVAIIFGLSGCKNDKLNPIPQASIQDEFAFSTPNRIAQQVNGIYSGLKNGNFLGGRALVYNDVRGEDWVNITNNNVTANGVYNYSVGSTDNQVEGLWTAGYAAINRANLVIDGIDANPNVIPASLATVYKAEARFARALAYFQLATTYGQKPYNVDAGASLGVPLRLTGNKTIGGDALPRSTMAQTFSQILTDLNFAETNLPNKYAAASDSNVIRAHKNAAIALKTRVYLQMGDYSNVITEGNKIVSNNAPFVASSGVLHSLNPVFVDLFRNPYVNLESIFSLPMNNNNSPGVQNGLALYHSTEFNLSSGSNSILSDANWKATDTRKVLATSTKKYQKYNDDLNNWVSIIRYSEVLLNLAEALAQQATGVDTRAVAILNAVRKRSDPSTTFAPTNKVSLIQLILNERRIELLGEGFRSLDIQRQVIPFPAKGSLSAIPPTAQNYVWPIPASELLYNNACVPN